MMVLVYPTTPFYLFRLHHYPKVWIKSGKKKNKTTNNAEVPVTEVFFAVAVLNLLGLLLGAKRRA